MRCVCCGYQATPREQREDPYRCPQCEPQTWRASTWSLLIDCLAETARYILRRPSRHPLRKR